MNNTYELCLKIRSAILNRAAEAMNYDKWADATCAREMRNAPDEIMDWSRFHPINPNKLTARQMDDLGFGVWEKGSGLRLIPLWLLPFLSPAFLGGCIESAEPRLLLRDGLSKDSRFGCLAYGVIPKGKGK
jgi:hypothetical protein